MVSPITSLSNMEYMLYGNTLGYGSSNAPSMMNNYCMNLNNNYGLYPYMNQYMNPYMNSYYANPYNISGQYNPTFSQSIPSEYTTQNTNTASNSVFAGLSAAEQNAIVNDYAQSLDPSESFLGAAAGAAGFSLLFHPRAIIHPINTYKSFKRTDKIFKGIKQEGTNLYKAWCEPGTNSILRDAYAATNRIDARAFKGKGFWHIWRNGFENKREYAKIKNIMVEAIDKYKLNPCEETLKGIQNATAQLNAANVKNGLLPRGWNQLRQWFGGEAIPTAYDSAIAEGTKIEKAAQEAAKKAAGGEAAAAVKGLAKGKSYLETLKTSGGGVKGGLFFLAIEYLTSMSKIRDSFEKDSKTGWKQLGQTTVKGLGSAAGWAAGEALGVWGTTKLLAAAGSAIAPGIGTAIGAVAGMIVGSIGCWLTGKITKKLVGQDVGDKVQAEKLAKTNEGQIQLLQNTATRMQNGEAVNPQAQAAVQKLFAQYANA